MTQVKQSNDLIFRKQSLWLLLAGIFNAGILMFDIYRVSTTDAAVSTSTALRASDNFPLLLMALVITIMPIVAIFLFKNRKRQVRMAAFSLIFTTTFITFMLQQVTRMAPVAPATGSYWVGAVLPVVSMLFIILAIVGIRKDDKLVKSTDRLR
jgi:Ca2+/Na+ antiporter